MGGSWGGGGGDRDRGCSRELSRAHDVAAKLHPPGEVTVKPQEVAVAPSHQLLLAIHLHLVGRGEGGAAV